MLTIEMWLNSDFRSDDLNWGEIFKMKIAEHEQIRNKFNAVRLTLACLDMKIGYNKTVSLFFELIKQIKFSWTTWKITK